MKSRTASIVAASTLALLSAGASPQELPATQPGFDTARPVDPASTAGAAEEALERAMSQVDADYEAYRAANPNPPPRLPGPAAGFPPAPTVPPIPANQLRANLLHLLESIQTLEGADRPLVEAIMGVKMGKRDGTDSFFEYYGSVDEGWRYRTTVWPRDDQPNSTINFYLGRPRPTTDDPAQCTFDVDEFLDEMKATGWTIEERWYAERSGTRYHGFRRPQVDKGFSVGGRLYIHFLGKNAINGPACVTKLMINAGRLRGEP